MTEDDFHKQTTQPGVGGPLNEPAALPVLPDKIGPYKIESLLEQGGMSLIYLGTHPATKDPVTIKVLLPKFLSNQEVVKRFLSEAEIISLANHPHVVRLYGQGDWEGGLYIAMEFIQGVSLRQFIQHNPMSLRRALEVVLDISYALCHLHTHGIIHRDLKPENILMTENEGVKVIDFGIAQLLPEKDQQSPDQPYRFMGTPFYMSPEQKENPQSVSYPSDIYSLGIIIYELVLGKLSHGQIHLSLLPKGLQKILAKMLQPQPQDRYQDIVDFISDLSTYLNSDVLEKEKKGGDQLSEISEKVLDAQSTLVAKELPKWSGVEIGLATYKGLGIVGSYYDFMNLQNHGHGFLCAEPASKGVEGVVFSAQLRGMVQAFIRLEPKPSELIALLNDVIIKDPSHQIYTLSYLTLFPHENLLHYISCGYGSLWHIPAGTETPKKIAAENIALGVEEKPTFKEVSIPWNAGDSLVYTNFALTMGKEKILTEQQMQQLITDNMHLTPQKQSEVLLRKFRTAVPRTLEERPIVMLNIHRE